MGYFTGRYFRTVLQKGNSRGETSFLPSTAVTHRRWRINKLRTASSLVEDRSNFSSAGDALTHQCYHKIHLFFSIYKYIYLRRKSKETQTLASLFNTRGECRSWKYSGTKFAKIWTKKTIIELNISLLVIQCM